MTRDESEGTTTFTVSKLEMWVVRGLGLGLVGLVSWIGTEIKESSQSMENATIAIAEIRTELSITRPTIEHSVNSLTKAIKEIPSESEIKAMLTVESPWAQARDEWKAWRLAIDASVKTLAASVEAGIKDRIYRREIRLWMEDLARKNPNLIIPSFD